jgi:hypothetical protein
MIDVVEGPIVVTTSAWGRADVTVGGVPAPRTRKSEFALPGRGGRTVQATVRSSLTDPYPTLEIGGIRHRTGPKVPAALQALALLPFLLVAVGGLLGGLIGGLGVAVNLTVARARIPASVKALIMIGVAAIGYLVWAVIASALDKAMS